MHPFGIHARLTLLGTCAEGVQFYCPSRTHSAIPYCTIFSIFSTHVQILNECASRKTTRRLTFLVGRIRYGEDVNVASIFFRGKYGSFSRSSFSHIRKTLTFHRSYQYNTWDFCSTICLVSIKMFKLYKIWHIVCLIPCIYVKWSAAL